MRALAAVLALVTTATKAPKGAHTDAPPPGPALCIPGEIPGCSECLAGDLVACVNIASAFSTDGRNARRAVPLANWLCMSWEDPIGLDLPTISARHGVLSTGCLLLAGLFSGSHAAEGIAKDAARVLRAYESGCYRFEQQPNATKIACMSAAQQHLRDGDTAEAAKFFKNACERGDKDGCEQLRKLDPNAEIPAPQ